MNTPPRCFIEVEGLRTAYLTGGADDSPPILMLHGWGAEATLVWPLAERLVTQGHRVLVPDLPGFGATPEPPLAWSVHDYVKFTCAFLDALQIPRANLFGHSFGGRIGLVLGADHSDRLHKMVLANSAGVRPRTPLARRLRLRAYRSLRQTFHAIGMRTTADSLRNWYNRRYGSADFQNTTGIMRETFMKVVNEDLLPYAARVRPSTLLLWGDADDDTPLWQGQRLEKTIPDAGLVVYAGAGHYSYLDRLPDAVHVIDYFLQQEKTHHA